MRQWWGRSVAKSSNEDLHCRADKCEEIWAEPVNFRAGGKDELNGDEARQRDSFEATLAALKQGGHEAEAQRFEAVAHDDAAWERHCRATFEAFVAAVGVCPRTVTISGCQISAPAKSSSAALRKSPGRRMPGCTGPNCSTAAAPTRATRPSRTMARNSPCACFSGWRKATR